MKVLLLLLFPIFSFSQTKLDTVSFLSGKVKILAPKELKPMTDQMWNLKYQQRTRPVLVLSDEDGEVNLIADITQQPASESQLASFKDFQILVNSNYNEKSNCILWQGTLWIKGGKPDKGCEYFKKAKEIALTQDDRQEADRMINSYCIKNNQ